MEVHALQMEFMGTISRHHKRNINGLILLAVSSITILVYDYILTIQMEVDLVWSSSLSWVKVLYLIQRYTPFVDSYVLLLYVWLSSDVSGRTCTAIMNFCMWMHVIGITVSEILLTLRTWAACQARFKRLSWCLAIFATTCWIPVFVVESNMLKFTQFSPGFTPSHQTGGHRSQVCAVHGGSSFFYVTYVLVSVYQIGILGLMLIAGYPRYKWRARSSIFNVVFGQGILCYLILIALSIVNIVVVLVAPVGLSRLVMPISRVMHANLTSRTVLNIRKEMWGRGEEVNESPDAQGAVMSTIVAVHDFEA
ncbi:hypothetical protein Moror_2771 [Moniliophthora roreri MCA 2997]|uniref:DUF6533 domain-containing protein n=2 Tax=Moniliophthora roreri TaxID=221103 RepID=V2XCC0_MONRO|nr:hypothetical protein Moror_2771 [Moniliophthora roreri MCA 2997]